MSRSTVRHAAATWLAGANIAGVGTVFPSPPKVARSSDALANVPAGTPSGSVLFVEITETREIRAALGGATAGKKLVTHMVRLHLLFRSRQPKAEAAMDDHDTLVEAILQRLRADRTWGTETSSTPILQAGEGDAGITVATGMPKDAGTGTTLIWTAIDLDAVEYITA